MDPTSWWMQQSNPGFGQGAGPQQFAGMPMGTQNNLPPPPQVPPAPPAGPQAPLGGMFGGSGMTTPNPQRDQIAQSMMMQPRYGGV